MDLKREDGYKIDIDKLREKLNKQFDLFIWVNPNSPTGLHINKKEVESILLNSKGCKRIWIDETYIEYVGKDQTLDKVAEKSNNIFVCKSMSKVYALSGVRTAYLCAHPMNILQLKKKKNNPSLGDKFTCTNSFYICIKRRSLLLKEIQRNSQAKK